MENNESHKSKGNGYEKNIVGNDVGSLCVDKYGPVIGIDADLY